MSGIARLRVSRSAGAFFLAAGFALGVVLIAASSAPAAAQGFGWFGGLFGGGAPQRSQAPSFPGYGSGYGPASPNTYHAPRHRARRHPAEPVEPVEQAQKEPPKKKPPPRNASEFVYVFGDILGQQLANGLEDALNDRQGAAVIDKARGPSGLIATDYYDWPKAIATLLAGKDKIDVAVMMIGSNDRQPIREDGKTYAVGSDEWNAIYSKRIAGIDDAFRKKGVPLIWVGVPITKNSDFADDMAAFNDIYRDAAAKTGATYVDTWEAFSDDKGDFEASGPDINGQTVRLRSADGILFTRAGARKLAHFVETHVRRDLDGKAPIPVLPTVETPNADASAGKTNGGKPDAGKPVTAVVKPDAGPINNLSESPSASNGRLAAPTGYHGGEDMLVKGSPHAPPTGRADDLRWPADNARSP